LENKIDGSEEEADDNLQGSNGLIRVSRHVRTGQNNSASTTNGKATAKRKSFKHGRKPARPSPNIGEMDGQKVSGFFGDSDPVTQVEKVDKLSRSDLIGNSGRDSTGNLDAGLDAPFNATPKGLLGLQDFSGVIPGMPDFACAFFKIPSSISSLSAGLPSLPSLQIPDISSNIASLTGGLSNLGLPNLVPSIPLPNIPSLESVSNTLTNMIPNGLSQVFPSPLKSNIFSWFGGFMG